MTLDSLLYLQSAPSGPPPGPSRTYSKSSRIASMKSSHGSKRRWRNHKSKTETKSTTLCVNGSLLKSHFISLAKPTTTMNKAISDQSLK